MVFDTAVACARHMQAMHPHEGRLAGTVRSGAAASVVYGSVATMAAAQGPRLLEPGVQMANSPAHAAPDVGVSTIDVHPNGAAPVRHAVSNGSRDHPRPIGSDSDDDVPTLRSDTEDETDNDMLGELDEQNDEGYMTTADEARLRAAVHVARELRAARRNDGMERGTIGGMSRRRAVYWTSTAARIRAYYESMPEASQSEPVVNTSAAGRPSRFTSPALRGALRFSMTAGGSGLSEGDNVRFSEVVMDLERASTEGTDLVGPFCSMFETPHGFLTATREEQARVLARLRWMEVPIAIGDQVFTYYYRDILTAGLDALNEADVVAFGDNGLGRAGPVAQGSNEAVASGHGVDNLSEIDDDDESRVRHGTLDGDLYQQERRNVRATHGPTALVMGVQLHADEALVSWSGAHNIFPVRARFVNVIGRGGGWTTVGYIQHVPRAVGQTAARRLEVSDVRNDLLQRCLAVSLRTLTRASETGVTAPVPGRGDSFLVPRVVGLVVDQVEERAIMALMGNRCRFFCSPCMADKDDAPTTAAIRAVDRNVIQTLEAQLEAAIVRRSDPRPGRRRALGQEHSALAFAPALGAVHGLSTGSRFLYQIISFDLLHVWKLGVLRVLAQRLPEFLSAVCPGGGARLGPTTDTLEVLNLRAFELGRNCKVCPSAPGYARERKVYWLMYALCLAALACLVVAMWGARQQELTESDGPAALYPRTGMDGGCLFNAP